jgi:predicted dehydrogenase
MTDSHDYQRPPVRVALIGLGRSMFEEHYSVFKAHPAMFKVVAACDLLKERRDMIAADFPDCKMFRRYTDLLDERDIDLVDIATGSVDHVKHALASLRKGFWTLLESPMALTFEDAQVLRGAVVKAKNRLIVMHRGLFDADFLLAKQEMSDARLGEIYQIIVRKEDYVRRDDWQAIKRLGGGAAYYAMPDMMIQALKLLPMPPIQMWSDLKRVASLGDAEDYARVSLKTRGHVSADIEFNGGVIAPLRGPSFEIRGTRGTFSVRAGQTKGKLTMIDPSFEFPRRRSSVRTPDLKDLHEEFPVVETEVELQKGTVYGPSAFWKRVYSAVRTAEPFPSAIEDSIEAVKFSQLMKKTSPFGK